jgi:ABC-type lipoprotein release transport system permease subunit
MTFGRLLQHNLSFHWRAHLAVLLGVAVGAAVLTGALLVGDSLRGSLRDRAEEQRCGVDFALVRGQFFTAKPDTPGTQTGIILHGAARAGDGENARRANGVTILAGFDLAQFAGRGAKAEPPALPDALAKQLGVKTGDSITVRIPIASTIPSESLLGQREFNQTSIELTLKIASILPDDHPASVFRLQPGFAPPRNIIVPLAELQKELARIYPQFGSAPIYNAILAAGPREPVEQSLKSKLKLADLGLKWGAHPLLDRPGGSAAPKALNRAEANRVFTPAVAAAIDIDGNGELTSKEIRKWYDNYGHLSLESPRGIIDAPTTAAVLEASRHIGRGAAPTLVYVANSIEHGKESIPYSIVCALEPNLPPRLGPFLPPGVENLADDEIVLTDWKESPLLGLKPGEAVTLKYFKPELQDGKFVEVEAKFKLRGYLPLKGVVLNPQLTPAFPGVTDKVSVRDWNPPFPYVNTRMQKRDEDYWREYRTIPKAFVTLAAGRKLWASRYGDTTSVRITPLADPPEAWEDVQQEFERQLVQDTDPAAFGFVFDDLKARFAAASEGGQDFGGLFLGFSFFLIASALLLVGLLTRLNVERRASEVGLLLATGWRFRTVRWLLLAEGLVISTIGGVLGVLAAVAYAGAMIWLLRELWPDAAAGTFLRLHIGAMSVAIGYVASLLISVGTIFWALRWLGRIAASALLAGQTETTRLPTERRTILARIAIPVLIVCLLGGLASLVAGGKIDDPMFRALAFFSGGALLLTTALMLIWCWLKSGSHSAHLGQGPAALAKLGARNARRSPARSLLTAGLLSSAAFLLVAVESFRRRPEGDFEQIGGGSGGCPLIVETTQPMVREFNAEVMAGLQQYYQSHPVTGSTTQQRLDHAAEVLGWTKVYSFRKSSGDDASCLNLYQAGRPQVLGVPANLIERGGFRVIDSEAKTPEEKKNPWLLLTQSREDGAIPIAGEQNTITWMLKKGLGDELTIADEAGQPVRLRVVAILKDSVFQSEILMSSTNFGRVFPHTEGFTYHLVETSPPSVEAVTELLRPGLARYEPEFTRSADRVAAYMAVENTYLTTFQLLGGLGLLLGALGLAVVMLRGIWERRSELALLRALGYRHQSLGVMVLAENALLLLLGLAAGVGTAVLSVLPHLALGASIPWARLALLLGVVAVAGLLAGAFAVRSTLRAPLLPALRKE